MSTGVLVGLIIVGAVLVLGLIATLARKSSTPSGSQKVCGGCKRVMLPQWSKCLFCGWAPVARLEFILGPMANQTLPLTDNVTTIGSVAGNTVVLADPAVSRKHAGIRRVESDYELADLGSTNGVYVNGQKVPKKTLEPGDIIRVGNTEAVFKRE
ncbi:MAG TPA: FHA domain-containing protein [Kofleriaceae bacterium]